MEIIRNYYIDYEVPIPGENAGMTLHTEGPFPEKKARARAAYFAGNSHIYKVRLRTMIMVERLETSEVIK